MKALLLVPLFALVGCAELSSAVRVSTTTPTGARAAPRAGANDAAAEARHRRAAQEQLDRLEGQLKDLTTQIDARCKTPDLYRDLAAKDGPTGTLYMQVHGRLNHVVTDRASDAAATSRAVALQEKLGSTVGRCTVLPADRYSAGDVPTSKRIAAEGLAPKGCVAKVSLGGPWKREKGVTHTGEFYDHSFLPFAAIVVEPDGRTAIWEGDLRKDHLNGNRVAYYGNADSRLLTTLPDASCAAAKR